MSFARSFAPLAAGLLVVALAAGCYPSNVLEEADRAVLLREETVDWAPLDAAGLPGAWASDRIEGDLAVSLLEVRYLFHPGGAYTGAGLVVGDGDPAYQTLEGTWTLVEGRLILDGVEPGVTIHASGERIRLSSDSGTIVMRRFELR